MGLTGQIINLLVVAGTSEFNGPDKYSLAMADALLKQTAGAEQRLYGWAAWSSQ